MMVNKTKSDAYSYDNSKQSDNDSFADNSNDSDSNRDSSYYSSSNHNADFAIKNDDAGPDARVRLHDPCPANC